MRSRSKALFLTVLFMILFLSLLYCVTIFYSSAWRVYGVFFGILGVVYFTRLLYEWIVFEPRKYNQEMRQ